MYKTSNTRNNKKYSLRLYIYLNHLLLNRFSLIPVILNYIICLMYLRILNFRAKHSCTISVQELKCSYSIYMQYIHHKQEKISRDFAVIGSYKATWLFRDHNIIYQYYGNSMQLHYISLRSKSNTRDDAQLYFF